MRNVHRTLAAPREKRAAALALDDGQAGVSKRRATDDVGTLAVAAPVARPGRHGPVL
jgi:hypothetical protein